MFDMQPTVTVAIPFHKSADPLQLEKAIRSILSQTREPDVVLLIQDGEVTQELEAVVDQFHDKTIEIITFQENHGLAHVLNHSINISDTKYYARMDADDISLSDRLEKQIKYLEEKPDVDVLGGAIELIDDDGIYIGIRNYPTKNDDIRNYIHLGSPFAHPTVVFRKSVFKIKDINYNTNLKVNQDIDLWFRMLHEGVVFANLEDVVLKYRISSEFYKRRGVSKAKDELSIYLRGLHKEFGYSSRMIFPILRFISRCSPVFIKKKLYNKYVGKMLNRT